MSLTPGDGVLFEPGGPLHSETLTIDVLEQLNGNQQYQLRMVLQNLTDDWGTNQTALGLAIIDTEIFSGDDEKQGIFGDFVLQNAGRVLSALKKMSEERQQAKAAQLPIQMTSVRHNRGLQKESRR